VPPQLEHQTSQLTEPVKDTTIMQVFKAGVLYFALVFAVGFVQGIVRTLWVVPRVGTRMAELMATPIMLVVTIVTTRWVVLRFVVLRLPSARLGVGGIALVLDAHRGIRVCALASGPVDEGVSRGSGPCVWHGVLRDAGGVCCHASSDWIEGSRRR
jgi:hypothetical protein